MANPFRRWVDHLTRSTEQLEADELQTGCLELGATRIADVHDRTVVHVTGVVRNVTIPPRGKVPALVAEIYDGSGDVDLVWLGRREITGINPGVYLRAQGRCCTRQGRPTIFNPRYELVAHPES